MKNPRIDTPTFLELADAYLAKVPTERITRESLAEVLGAAYVLGRRHERQRELERQAKLGLTLEVRSAFQGGLTAAQIVRGTKKQ